MGGMEGSRWWIGGCGAPALGGSFRRVSAALAGCRQEMEDQPRCGPLEASTFSPTGAVRGRWWRERWRGAICGSMSISTPARSTVELADTLPFPLTRQLLERGQERFNIYCSPCHDHARQWPGDDRAPRLCPPPSFHIDRLREAPVGYFFEVMTDGYGAMMDYAAQVSPHDRWAIAAYIRALQLSQHATLADVPDEERQHLQGATP